MTRLKRSRRWQFGLLALSAMIAIAAIAFAFLRPPIFPGDDLIRKDLGIPNSIPIAVFDRHMETRDGVVTYSATVHVSEKPHRLLRIQSVASGSLADRQKWAPLMITDHYDNGSFDFRYCERLYGKPPTEKELNEFRQFAANFR